MDDLNAMPRTPARCTEADINRAAKVAVRNNMIVLIKPDGTIILEPVNSGDEAINQVAECEVDALWYRTCHASACHTFFER